MNNSNYEWINERYNEQMEDLLEFLYEVKDKSKFRRRTYRSIHAGHAKNKYNRHHVDGNRQRHVINLPMIYDEWKARNSFSLNNRCFVSYEEAEPEISEFLDFIGIMGDDKSRRASILLVYGDA